MRTLNIILALLFMKLEKEEVIVITEFNMFEASITPSGFGLGGQVVKSEQRIQYFLKTLIGKKKILIKTVVTPNQKAGY